MKNILFFSVSIGAGHDSAAKALEQQLLEKNPELKTRIIDTFDYINHTLHKVVLESYMETLKFNPKVWGYLYDQAEGGERIIDLGQILNKLLSHKLHQLIEEFKPDMMICTHAFPAGILSVLKAKTNIDVPVVAILTDYTVHGFWIHPNIDYYIIPSNELMFECIERGMPEQKIRPYGIPINNEFAHALDKEKIKEKLGLKNGPVVLVMGGGLGLGSVKETVMSLLSADSNLQVLAVAGKNEKLYNDLKFFSMEEQNLYVYGYINNVAELMSASDLIITKPGGLTTAEVLSKALPMVIVNPLPGQEDRNTEFLLNCGVAVKARKHSLLPILISQLFSNNLRMGHMRDMATHIAKPNAVHTISDFIIEEILMNKAKKC